MRLDLNYWMTFLEQRFVLPFQVLGILFQTRKLQEGTRSKQVGMLKWVPDTNTRVIDLREQQPSRLDIVSRLTSWHSVWSAATATPAIRVLILLLLLIVLAFRA